MINRLIECLIVAPIYAIIVPLAFIEWIDEENPNHAGYYDQHTTRTGFYPGS